MTVVRHPRTRKIVVWMVSIIAGFGILLGLIAPPLLRGKLATELTKKLHRDVTIAQLKINPYAMTMTLRGFVMKEPQSQRTAVSFDELFVNLDIRSLFRFAPVVEELRLATPYVNLVRNEDGKYNFQDLIDEMTSGPSGPTPRFALNNIQITDGKIDFDDRPEQTKHEIHSLKIGIPFISSLVAHVTIKVQPELDAVVNGAPFHLAGNTTSPFKDTLESTINLGIDKLEIAKYLEYAPVVLNFKVPSGQLSGNVSAVFKTDKDSTGTLVLSGNLGVQGLEMQGAGGAPLLKLTNFDVVVDSFAVFAKKLHLKSVASHGLELHVGLDRNGEINLAHLVAAPATAGPADTNSQAAKPFAYQVDDIAFEGATIHFIDQQPQNPYKTDLDNLTLKLTGLNNEEGKNADVELSFETKTKENFSHSGTIQLTPLLAKGTATIRGMQLKGLRPYYENVIGVEFKDGLLDLSTHIMFAQNGAEPDIKLTELNASLRSLRADVPGETEPLWRVPLLAVKDAAVDIAKRSVVVGALESRDGRGFVKREQDGTISYARLIKTRAVENETKAPVKADTASWSVQTKRVAINRFGIVFEDRSLPEPARIVVTNLSLLGENFSNAPDSRAKLTLQATIDEKGNLKVAGPVGTRPVAGQVSVDVEGIDIVPFRPYLGEQFNFLLTSGVLGTKGTLVVDAPNNGPMKLSYDGSAQVLDFAIVEKSDARDLLKWNSLTLGAVQFSSEPFRLRIGEINLADFYSRLILGADGKINLQKLTVQKNEGTAVAPAQAQAVVKPADNAPSATGSTKTDQAISIGKINFRGGNVYFSDFFIKPNYSANLTGVEGTVSELKPDAPGNLDLRASLDNAAPVEINGKINPLSKELFLDLVADAKEIELNPLTPYSAKYVGYGIEKGKLSFNVKYQLENRKLSAQNKFILNQLTFGDKIESPQATKLPVLLAVALLKDRNGVIDVNLPISGSLDDPQFSVGGIIFQIIVNIITKAVTAPFSLLAAAFGGGSGDELSYIEFDSGRANLNPAAKAKIGTLGKALANRPGLSLELIGRVDPVADLDGLKRESLERKVKSQKLKDMLRRGAGKKSIEDVQVDPKEYPQYLKAAYGEESFPKPRNFIGIAQDLPVPEMEKLMLQHAKAGDEELRQLANQRALTVRDALLGAGQISSERLFIVAAKPLTKEEAAKIKGKFSRVDFTMK